MSVFQLADVNKEFQVFLVLFKTVSVKCLKAKQDYIKHSVKVSIYRENTKCSIVWNCINMEDLV